MHLHEIWHVPQLLGAITSHIASRCYAVSPHGGLEPAYPGQHPLAKLLLWQLYQKRILLSASMIHALTAQEEQSVRLAGVGSPVTIIHNRIDLRLIDQSLELSRDHASESEGGMSPYILCLGRIDPKKGIDVLLEAFSLISKAHPDIQLIVAGPDPYWFCRRLAAMVPKLDLAGSVKYLGFVDETSKFRLMAAARLFVLPSRSEGMSVAALEALACGTPVIASSSSNLPEIEEMLAGRIVPPTPRLLAEACIEILEDDPLRDSISSNARKLAEQRFSSTSMQSAMAKMYGVMLQRQDATR